MLVGHVHIFLGEMSIQVLCPFSNWAVWFFVVEYVSFEYLGAMGQELNGTSDVLRCLRCPEV